MPRQSVRDSGNATHGATGRSPKKRQQASRKRSRSPLKRSQPQRTNVANRTRARSTSKSRSPRKRSQPRKTNVSSRSRPRSTSKSRSPRKRSRSQKRKSSKRSRSRSRSKSPKRSRSRSGSRSRRPRSQPRQRSSKKLELVEYDDLITRTIQALEEKEGSSYASIRAYIVRVCRPHETETMLSQSIKHALREGVDSGIFVQREGEGESEGEKLYVVTGKLPKRRRRRRGKNSSTCSHNRHVRFNLKAARKCRIEFM